MHLSEGGLRVFTLDLVNEADHAVVPVEDLTDALGLATFANLLRFGTFSSHVGQMSAESFVQPTIPAVVNTRCRPSKA